MSLNDDVMVDIDPNVEPFPLPKSDELKNIFIKVEPSVLDDTKAKDALTDVFSNDTKLGELPNLAAEFKVCVDGVDEVITMKDIEDDILSKQTINQESATIIDTFVGDFLGERFSLEEFSVAGSKTNYTESIKFIQSSINTKEESVGRALIEFYKSTEGVTRSIRLFLEKDVIPFIEKASDELLPKYNELMTTGAGAMNAVFPMKDGNFVNVLTAKLNAFSMDNVDFDNIDDFFGMNKEEFKSLFIDIQEAIKNPTLASYIHNLSNEKETLCSSVAELTQVVSEGFSINELISFFNSFFKCGHRLDEIKAYLINAETFYGNQSNVLDDKYQPTVEFVAANAKMLSEKNCYISFSHTLALNLSVFIPLVSKIFFVVDKLET